MMSDRIELERNYWNQCALDENVDEKYISDISTEECLRAINFNALNGPSLEIGCGVGRIVRNWSDGHGIDVSRNMVILAKQRDPKNEYKVCDGRTIPYDDNFFYQIACVLVFQHLEGPTIYGYMQEVFRVLKPGGIFRFQYIPGNSHEGPFSNHYDTRQIRKWLKLSGLEFMKEDEGLCHPQWSWVTARKPEA